MPHYYYRHTRAPLLIAFSPLCASNTISKWFAESECPEQPEYRRKGRFMLRRSEVSEHPDLRKILVVRDPVDRLVSFYGHFVVGDDKLWCFADDERRVSLVGCTFRELLSALEDLQARAAAFQHHLVPQVAGAEGIRFDRVVRTEGLDDLLCELSQEFGFDVSPRRSHVLPREGSEEFAADRSPAWLRQHGIPPSSCFYDEGLRARARALYPDDLSLYASVAGSQAGQDRFVLSVLGADGPGTFVDVGCGLPFDISNSERLEREGWRGVALDIRDHSESWRKRRTPFVRIDALRCDYARLFRDHGLANPIDYLSLDLEQCGDRAAALERILGSGTLFRVITIEHDAYKGERFAEAERRPQRRLLASLGYELVCADVCYGSNPFEDWWVHPGRVPEARYGYLRAEGMGYREILAAAR